MLKLEKKNIIAYAMDPGWCRTDMGGSCTTYSAENGANIGIFLIKLQDGIIPNLQG